MIFGEKTTARETFSKNMLEADHLLGWIGEELEMYEEYAEKDGLGWNHAETAQHYREQLMQILIGLLGNSSEKESRKMIEKALVELKG